MEITELNLIDFESKIFPMSTLSKVPKIYSLCKWLALIITILAAFRGLIVRTKFLILKISRIKIFSSSTIDSIKLLNSDNLEYDIDDDDNDACSSVSSNEEYDKREGVSDEEKDSMGRQFSWSDFNAGKSVVRLWEDLTAGFDYYEEKTDDVISVGAEEANNGGVLLGLYDSRVRSGLPEMTVEWPLLRRRLMADVNSGGVERVYVRDDVTGGLAVGDLRKFKLPLGEWDANSVIDVDYR